MGLTTVKHFLNSLSLIVVVVFVAAGIERGIQFSVHIDFSAVSKGWLRKVHYFVVVRAH